MGSWSEAWWGGARSGPRRIVSHLRGMPRMYRPLAKNARGDPRRFRVIDPAIRAGGAKRKRQEEWDIQNTESRHRSIWPSLKPSSAFLTPLFLSPGFFALLGHL